MNPGDIMLYWRSDTTRSLAMEGAVKRASFWPQSVFCEHGVTRVTLYGGSVEFEAPEAGDLNAYDTDGKPSAPEAVDARDALPEDGHFPVTAFFRLPKGGLIDGTCRVEGQMSGAGMINLLPGSVLLIEPCPSHN